MLLEDVIKLAAHQGVRRLFEKRAGALGNVGLATLAATPWVLGGADDKKNQVTKALRDPKDFSHNYRTAQEKTANPFGMALREMLGFGGSRDEGKPGYGFKGSFGVLGGAPLEGVAKGVTDLTASPFAGAASGISELIQRKILGQELGDRQDALGMAGASAAKTLGSEAAKATVGNLNQMIQDRLFEKQLGDRQDTAALLAGSAAKSFGSEIGKAGVGLLKDMANKAVDAVSGIGNTSAREAIIGELKRTDAVLSQADNHQLMEAYHTMVRFAPTLSTDKNAVRSFLRQSVMSGAGPDFMTIKHLADSERAVTGRLLAAQRSD